MVKYQHLMVGYLVLVVLTLIPPQLFYVLTSQSYMKKVSQVEDRGEQLAHNIQKLTIKQYIKHNNDIKSVLTSLMYR